MQNTSEFEIAPTIVKGRWKCLNVQTAQVRWNEVESDANPEGLEYPGSGGDGASHSSLALLPASTSSPERKRKREEEDRLVHLGTGGTEITCTPRLSFLQFHVGDNSKIPSLGILYGR